VAEEKLVKLRRGWACVRCEGTHAYCVNCGSIRCCCPEPLLAICGHGEGARKRRVGKCSRCKRPICDGEGLDYVGGLGEVCASIDGGCPDTPRLKLKGVK